MGRDMTPREHHMVDVAHGFSKEKLVMTNGRGEEVVLYDPDCELCRRFPNLYFLTNGFKHLSFETITEEDRLFWDRIEKYVAKCVDTDTPNVVPGGYRFVWKWYIGRLDPDFYYSEKNEELFLHACKEMLAQEKLVHETEKKV